YLSATFFNMKNSIIIRVVILGAISILGIMAVQTYWVLRTWDLKEKEFHEKIEIALLNVAKNLEKLGGPLPPQNLISQISSNYYVVNINDVINANLLEFYLVKELELVGLQEDFEYGIYDCSSNKMVYGNYVTFSSDKPKENIKRDDLSTYDDYLYYFGVRFPDRTGYMLNSMRLTIIFSVILLLTISFFLYTTYIILRQKRLSEMQKDFINNMTHEFKTPISTIKISANTFLNHPLVKADERLAQYARIINEQNDRLNAQVEKVLQLARIERDNFQLHLEEVNLHELIEKIVASTRLKVGEQGGDIATDLKSNHPVISADRLHLTNILHNLIDNAMKYCKDCPEITIRTEDTENHLKLSIADRGIGIPQEYQGRVFEKFYRVPTGNVHNVKGFGLGLYYIKNICRAHGWKITLKSEAGKGTEICIGI
ncbi:MAG TPA: HAMP domain-containing sensor histidine kinase, partial [Saprospiraceae bacterium]|nr:HAMP domain-containing sensor histidine kinase [Saprospiraceae bacterium]